MANKTTTGILTSETQEDIKVLGLVGERGRWGFFVDHKSHQDLWADCRKDLAGGERKLLRCCQYNTGMWMTNLEKSERKQEEPLKAACFRCDQ